MINRHKLTVLGIMSGTSLDGLDFCLVDFWYMDGYHYKINESLTIPYAKEWQHKLKGAFGLSASMLDKLSKEYGAYIGTQVVKFLEKTRSDADLISCHGHTVFHRPNEGITLQIGDGKTIQEICQIPVVNNFRQQDVAMGGQGAPLVPVGDQLLFSGYDFCLNLGGFSNVSTQHNNRRIAFDTGPCNILLNHIASRLHVPYDAEGKLAERGSIIQHVLDQWNGLSFFTLSPPKSLGREWFEENYMQIIRDSNLNPLDLLATSTEHIVHTIAKQLEPFIQKIPATMLITGGGAFNDYLVQCLHSRLEGKIEIILPDVKLIECKEALIFAFLGYLRIQNIPNVLSSVTGASADHCSGDLYT